jgi:hypothetical protein
MNKGRVKATVRVVMDVEDDSVWGSDTTWEFIVKDAENGVRNVLTQGNELALKALQRRIKSVQMVSVTFKHEGAD